MNFYRIHWLLLFLNVVRILIKEVPKFTVQNGLVFVVVEGGVDGLHEEIVGEFYLADGVAFMDEIAGVSVVDGCIFFVDAEDMGVGGKVEDVFHNLLKFNDVYFGNKFIYVSFIYVWNEVVDLLGRSFLQKHHLLFTYF